MIVLGPNGELIQVEPFHGACINFFRQLGARSMFTETAPKAPPGCTIAFVAFERSYEIAAGRSQDEALVRVIQRIVDRGHCGSCNRPTWFDAENVTKPLDPNVRHYLDNWVDSGEKVCTVYFDHRVLDFAKSCDRFDPVEPVHDAEWNEAPKPNLIVPEEKK